MKRHPLIHLLMAALVLLSLSSCGCVPISDDMSSWAAHQPPLQHLDELTPQFFYQALRTEINPPIVWWKNYPSVFTTTFKRAGLMGWKETRHTAVVSGLVGQEPVQSWDGFLTVDIKLTSIQFDGSDIPITDRRFLRAEICAACIGFAKSEFPRNADLVTISGPILWDGDGFFEIHPIKGTDIQVNRS